jgi:hypothetical protein
MSCCYSRRRPPNTTQVRVRAHFLMKCTENEARVAPTGDDSDVSGSESEDDSSWLADDNAEAGRRDSVWSQVSHNNALSRILTSIKRARGTTSKRRGSDLMHTSLGAVPSIALSVLGHDAPTVTALHVSTSNHKRRKRTRHGDAVQHVPTAVDSTMPPICNNHSIAFKVRKQNQSFSEISFY